MDICNLGFRLKSLNFIDHCCRPPVQCAGRDIPRQCWLKTPAVICLRYNVQYKQYLYIGVRYRHLCELNTCKAKRQQSCRLRSMPIDNTYHLKGYFKCNLYPSILKNLDNMALCYTCYFPASLPRYALHKMEPGPSIAQ